jgi:hypothetical protein
MRSKLVFGVAALLCGVGITVADAATVTWRFDFTSSRGNGFFEVDPTNFVIPSLSSQPSTFNVVAADINITDAGGLFGQVHYTLNNIFQTNCTPAECSLVLGITNVVVPNISIYDAVELQLNFEKIWVPWTAVDQQTIQMWFHTIPNANALDWNAAGSVQRTVLSAVHEPSTWAMMLLGFAGIGFMAYRRKSKPALMAA